MEPIQNKSNNTVYIISLIVIVIIIVLIVFGNKKKESEPAGVIPGSEDTTLNTDSNIDPDKEGTSISNAGKYADLVLKYQDRTLQFNQECSVIRNSYTFKQGTDALLDNRGQNSAKIVIGSRTYNLKGYGYRVIDLGSVGTFQVDCNDKQNVLTVNVQK